MKVSRAQLAILLLISLSLSACNSSNAQHAGNAHTVTVTTVRSKAVTFTQRYVCRINSHRQIDVRAAEPGILEAIQVKEGQAVKQNDLLFRVGPLNVREQSAVKNQRQAVSIKAPFDGLVGRLPYPEGTLVQKGDTLTTLSDNSVMWVYFNVPEASYLEYMSHPGQNEEDRRIELMLANGSKFQYPSTGLTVEANFNIENGNIPFRADFPNPHGLLRHGQTGTVLIHRTLKNALVIPQRATFEILDKRYVWVVGSDDVVHQRLITVEHELDDIFVIKKELDVKDKKGLDAKDKFVFEGVREVRDGDKVEYELRPPDEVLANQKNHAE